MYSTDRSSQGQHLWAWTSEFSRPRLHGGSLFILSEEEAEADSQTQGKSDKEKEQHWYTQKLRNSKECSKSQSIEKLKLWLWEQKGMQVGPELRVQPSDSNEQVLIRWGPDQACGKATVQKQCVGYKCLSSLAIQASSAGCDTPCSGHVPVGGAGPPVPINYRFCAFLCLVLIDKLLL